MEVDNKKVDNIEVLIVIVVLVVVVSCIHTQKNKQKKNILLSSLTCDWLFDLDIWSFPS